MDRSRANGGYLGLCLVQAANETAGNTVICTTVAFRSLGDVKSELQDQANSTLSNWAIQAGVTFANSAAFIVLGLAFLAYVGSLLFDVVFSISTGRNRKHLRAKDDLANLRRRQNRYLKSSLLLSWASLSIAFSAAVAVTESVKALEVNLDSAISASPGQVSLALHWLIVITSGISSLCWTLIYRTHRKMDGSMVSGQDNQEFIEPERRLSYSRNSGGNMPILTPATGPARNRGDSFDGRPFTQGSDRPGRWDDGW